MDGDRDDRRAGVAGQRVWAILVDLANYASWNPWLVKVDGSPTPGATVWADVILGEKRRRAEHVVLVVEPHTRFCWRDAGWTTAFAYGQRCRWLTLQPDGTVLFRQEAAARGLDEEGGAAALRPSPTRRDARRDSGSA